MGNLSRMGLLILAFSALNVTRSYSMQMEIEGDAPAPGNNSADSYSFSLGSVVPSDIIQASDGSLVAVGNSFIQGLGQIIIFKLNRQREVAFVKFYRGPIGEGLLGFHIRESGDGKSYIVVGSHTGPGSSPFTKKQSPLFVRVSAPDGTLLDVKKYRQQVTSDPDSGASFESIVQDGGSSFAILGNAFDNGSGLDRNAFIIKLKDDGTLVSANNNVLFGTKFADAPRAFIKSQSGDFMTVFDTKFPLDNSGTASSEFSLLVVRQNSSLQIIGSRVYGTTLGESANEITDSGLGYLVITGTRFAGDNIHTDILTLAIDPTSGSLLAANTYNVGSSNIGVSTTRLGDSLVLRFTTTAGPGQLPPSGQNLPPDVNHRNFGQLLLGLGGGISALAVNSGSNGIERLISSTLVTIKGVSKIASIGTTKSFVGFPGLGVGSSDNVLLEITDKSGALYPKINSLLQVEDSQAVRTAIDLDTSAPEIDELTIEFDVIDIKDTVQQLNSAVTRIELTKDPIR